MSRNRDNRPNEGSTPGMRAVKRMIISSLALASALTLVVGALLQFLLVRYAHRTGWVTLPSSRRRHKFPTPILGGLGLFGAWVTGMFIFSLLNPEFYLLNSNSVSTLYFGLTAVAMMTLGLVDDRRGLTPGFRLLVEFLLASIILFEPNIFAYLSGWTGIFGFIVWPLAVLWIVGLTNAINCIDGLDGLAGSSTFLILISLIAFILKTNDFSIVMLALLAPTLLAFLFFNASPAKIFLGDNGSLPLGFLLASISLTGSSGNFAWNEIACLILVFGYPIFDMGTTVFKRLTNGFSPFRADRSHLHYRAIRLGMTPKQVAYILIGIGFFFQVSAMTMHVVVFPFNLISIFCVVSGLGLVLFQLSYVERKRILKVSENIHNSLKLPQITSASVHGRNVMLLDLTPLLDTEDTKNHETITSVIKSIDTLLRRTLDMNQYAVYTYSKQIMIASKNKDVSKSDLLLAREHIRERVDELLHLFNANLSLASLPIRYKNIRLDKVA